MLLFHGGLPRSGKSYESVVEHLIPAIKKGRKVYARIDGLNYEKIASLAEVSLERCQDLLQHLTEEQAQNIELQTFDIGSLIIIDEVQNYWPEARQPLNKVLTKFVSEHGHQGLDILLMGQEFKDMHKLWKNRVSQKVEFRKLDMVGKAKEYRWILYKAVSPQKFVEVTKGTRPYDEKYFGTYKSFEEGAEGNQLYDDKRANIWNSKTFKVWIPLFGVVLLCAIAYLYHAFYGGGLAGDVTKNQPKKDEKTVTVTQTRSEAPPPAQLQAVTPKQPEKPKEPEKSGDLIEELSKKYRLRLTAIIRSHKGETAMFEWYDDGLKIKERLSMVTVVKLGYTVHIDDDMAFAIVSKGDNKFIATQFTTENEGRVPEKQLESIAGYPDRGRANIESEKTDSKQQVASADGWGVLGKTGPGVRQPGQ